jgi:hypothetical protein
MMRKLLPLLLILLLYSQAPVSADGIRYGGDAIVLIGSGPESISKLCSVRLLSLISPNGTSPLIVQNSTFNRVAFNGTHLSFVLEKNSTVTLIKDYGVALLLPFLIRVESGKIVEVNYLSDNSSFGNFELIEAKKGQSARISINGEIIEGPWIPGLEGWLFRREWSSYMEPSYLLLFNNGTYIAFGGIARSYTNFVTLGNVSLRYSRAELSLSNDSVFLRAFGPSIKARKVDAVGPEEGFFIYGRDNMSLVEVKCSGPSSFTVIDPKYCNTCEFNGNEFYFDSNFNVQLNVDSPSDVMSGSSFRILVAPPPGSREISIVFGNSSIVLRNISIPMRIEMRAPTIEREVLNDLFVTVKTNDGIFGLKREIKILSTYTAQLLNSTEVYLLGGRGSISIKVYNFGDLSSQISSVRMDLLGSKSGNISLNFQVYYQIPPKSSTIINLPLDIPVGEYLGNILMNISDSMNRIYSLSLENIKIISTPETPLSMLTFISPEIPNVGDYVKLSLSLSSAIPLEKLLVNVSSTGMDPISDTSKFLLNISEGEIIRLEFSFRAKSVGPSQILISAYYLPKGYSTYRTAVKEVKIPIGNVEGIVYAEANETNVKVGESIELRVRVEGVSGEVTIDFPKGTFIVESQGAARGNKVSLLAPADVKIVLSFNTTGNFTLPSFAIFNGTRALPINAVHVNVVGGAINEEERSLRAKLAELNRRYKTLTEASGSLESSDRELLDKVSDLLRESENLIDKGMYSDAERSLREAESILSSLEERAYGYMSGLINFLMYFIIGAGFSSLLLIYRRLGKRRKIWK